MLPGAEFAHLAGRRDVEIKPGIVAEGLDRAWPGAFEVVVGLRPFTPFLTARTNERNHLSVAELHFTPRATENAP